MNIYNSVIGFDQPTFVIAELCSNIISHLRFPSDLEAAVSKVAETGANAAKIQLFSHKHFPESEWESKKRVEFPRDRVLEFVELCHKHGLAAGVSVFDSDAVAILENSRADFIKMATRECDNLNLWQRVSESYLPVVASFEFEREDNIPPMEKNLIWLACIPKYPVIDPPVPIAYWADEYHSSWGWSSHTPDWLDCLIAVSHGACVIEKHIAFHANDPEAGWSLFPNRFYEMVRDIRRVERMR